MSDNITITFQDGNTKSVEKGISGFDLANQISKSLAKESVAIQIDGKICDLSLELNQDCRVVIIKRENNEALDIIRHDCAHVMAEAVQSLFPGTQVTIGPSIENGFYYDFARKEPFSLKKFIASSCDQTSLVNFSPLLIISCIFFSILGRSERVKGSLRAKS